MLHESNIMISVVVCTYNRAHLLKMCLESLADQRQYSCQYEVIVVDNGSSDNTAEVINSFQIVSEIFISLYEANQGLSHARNRGWRGAAGQYVAFIDDDAIANPDWISKIADFIERHPDIGVFGGPYSAFSLVEKPDWFPPNYGDLNFGDFERPIKIGVEWITGSNMIIRKSLFIDHGGFDVRLGMSGATIGYGEEIKFLLVMINNGKQIYCVPTIKVSHLVAEYKMSLQWLLYSNYASGRKHGVTFEKRALFSCVVTLGIAAGWSVYELLRPINIPLKRRLYFSLYRVCYAAGSVVEAISTLFLKFLR